MFTKDLVGIFFVVVVSLPQEVLFNLQLNGEVENVLDWDRKKLEI